MTAKSPDPAQAEVSPAALTIDPLKLRATLGAFPTGVTIITTLDQAGSPVGMTANSFSSVSLEPPLILWSIRRDAFGFAAYAVAEYFAVNILAQDQQDVSNLFARAGQDKFSQITTEKGVGGVPLLAGVTAQLECRTWSRYDGGDHLILVGEVLAFRRWMRLPLLFAAGRYETLTPHKDAGHDLDWPISFL